MMHKHFPDALKVSPIFGGCWKKRKMLAPFRYYPKLEDVPITVPKGFITDYASVPRFLWSLVPAWGRYGPAAIVHDFLYSAGTKVTRKQADKLFLLAMKQLGVGWLKRTTLYSAVRLFGCWAYKGGY